MRAALCDRCLVGPKYVSAFSGLEWQEIAAGVAWSCIVEPG